MEWYSRGIENTPKDDLGKGNSSQVSNARDTDVESDVLGMRSVNFSASWRSQTLHGVVSSTQQKSAQDIDRQMKP